MAVVDFSLNKIAPVAHTYHPVTTPFDPDASWDHHYMQYTLSSGSLRPRGEFQLTHTRLNARQNRLEIRFRRSAESRFSYFLSGQMTTRVDSSLTLPQNWTLTSKIARNWTDSACLGSEIQVHSHVRSGQLIEENGCPRPRPVGSRYTHKFCLPDSVQRASQTLDQSFTFIDENGGLWPDSRLRFRARRKIYDLNLTGFDLLGSGLIPTTLWRDQTGRVIFIISGIELYILKSAEGQDARYDDRPRVVPARNRRK